MSKGVRAKIIQFSIYLCIAYFSSFFLATLKIIKVFEFSENKLSFYLEFFLNTGHYYIIGPIIHVFLEIQSKNYNAAFWVLLLYGLLLFFIITISKAFFKNLEVWSLLIVLLIILTLSK